MKIKFVVQRLPARYAARALPLQMYGRLPLRHPGERPACRLTGNMAAETAS